jgi:Spy/CpxP family protein refolding chaperone
MRTHSKAAVALITLIVGLPLALAQDATPGSIPDQPAGKQKEAMHYRMHQQAMGERGQWNHMQARWGHGRRMGMHRRGWAHRQFMLARLVSNPSFRERLGITPEQAQKIRTQTSDFRKTQIRNRAELQVKHLELNDLLSVDNPDRAAIDKKLQEISAVHLASAKSAIDFRLAMRTALTPDQRQKLLQMREEFFRHGGLGHERPHGARGDAPFPDQQGE